MGLKKYRVIVWGLGNVGRAAIRMILNSQQLDLVGAVDVDPQKLGKDAGEVFGFKKTGIIVSDQLDQVIKTANADVVLDYTPLVRDEKGGFTPSAQAICHVLELKQNVITTLPIYFSQATDPAMFEHIDTVAKQNGVSYLPSGLLPGAYASYIPMVLSGIMGEVTKVTVQSGEDDQENTSSWVKVFGYGLKPETFPHERLTQGIVSYYVSGVYEIGQRLGYHFDKVETKHDYFTAPTDLHPKFGLVKKGTLYGHRFTMTGVVNGEAKVSLIYVHKICDDIIKEPQIDNKIRIDGIPEKLEVTLDGMMPLDESYATSAAPTVNAIPQVVKGPAGYLQALDLPAIIPVL